MVNISLTSAQRSALLRDIRQAMKNHPQLTPAGFQPHVAKKAEIMQAAEAFGIDVASYGSIASQPTPRAKRPIEKPAVAVQKVAEDVTWKSEAGLDQQADAILNMPYSSVRDELLAVLGEKQALQQKLDSKPVQTQTSNVVSIAPPAIEVPDLFEHVEDVQEVRQVSASEIFKGAGINRMLSVYNDTRAEAVDPNYMPDSKVATVFLSVVTRKDPAKTNVFFFGAAGTGKSSMARYFAAYTGRSFWPLTVSDDTSIEDFFGTDAASGGTTHWQDGLLLRACRQPYAVILIDEVSRCRPDVAVALNGLLQDRQYVVPRTGERIEIAEGVIICMADNTNGRGDASGLYAGAKQMDNSLLSRMAAKIRFDYPTAEHEAKVIHRQTGAPKPFCKEVVRFMRVCRKAHDDGEAPTLTVSLRESTSVALMCTDGIAPELALEMVIGNGLEAVDKETLFQLFNTHVNPDKWDTLARGDVWTEPANDEPVEQVMSENTDEMPFE